MSLGTLQDTAFRTRDKKLRQNYERDFWNTASHSEHLCTPCNKYRFNCITTVKTINLSCVHVKNESLSENSTGFEFLIRLLTSCFQLLHINGLLESITDHFIQKEIVITTSKSQQIIAAIYKDNWVMLIIVVIGVVMII